MRRWTRPSRVLAVLLGGLLVLSACGDSGKSSGRKGRKAREAKKARKKQATKQATAQEEEEEEAAFTFNESFTGRDPFRSFLKDFLQTAEQAESGLAELRTPLENFELTELTPIALITGTPVPKAMVEDPTGLGHMIQPGTRVGRRGGKVVRIAANTIVVRHIEEELGTVKESVLRLHQEGEQEISRYSVVRHDQESERARAAAEDKGVLEGLDVDTLLEKPQPGGPAGGAAGSTGAGRANP